MARLSGSARRRTAVLISGRGSNMAALLRAARTPGYPADIVLVLSNRPEAAGLVVAQKARVATAVVDDRPYRGDRGAHEQAIATLLNGADVEIVCLAGYLRVLTPAFVARYRGRMLNIHPSLLPAFPGLDTHAAALKAGVKLHGATVHLVTDKLDAGPILAQAAVPVLPGDDEAALAARVLAQEHVIYPAALRRIAAGLGAKPGDAPAAETAADARAALLNPPPDPPASAPAPASDTTARLPEPPAVT
jgi:formyltetrahydrofolate-dependent phosphoribosylglycinamide formyltransferase